MRVKLLLILLALLVMTFSCKSKEEEKPVEEEANKIVEEIVEEKDTKNIPVGEESWSHSKDVLKQEFGPGEYIDLIINPPPVPPEVIEKFKKEKEAQSKQ